MPKKIDKKPKVTRKQKIAAALLSEYSDGAGASISNDNAIEYLENPVKSDDDKKQYRVIKLANGLKALLISHPTDALCSGNVFLAEQVNGKENGDEKNIDALMFETLMRKVETVSVMASCKMSINVGSFSDTPDAPCISRLLKNVILACSTKYPQINSFEEFVISHGGRITEQPEKSEFTSFSFNIDSSHLYDAIDRFTNCFAHPVLKRNVIIAQRDIIRQEYEKEFFDCIEQMDHLSDILASISDDHPGNRLSDKYGPELFDKTPERLVEEVKKFMKRHYSANRMTVAIEAEWTLDTLEECVRKYFSRIPNNNLSPIDFSAYSYDRCFNISTFNKLYEIGCDYNHLNRIILSWSTPSAQRLYRVKPHRYVSWLMTKKSPGSLLDYLLNKGWCTNIDCYVGKTSFEENSIYSLFSLTIDLTDEGSNNYRNILDDIYSYVNFLKLNAIDKRLYEEKRKIETARFRFGHEDMRCDCYDEICNYMHVYPSTDYLTGNHLYWDYDPEPIKHFLECLSPDKANIALYGKSTTGLVCSPFGYHLNDDELCYYEIISFPKYLLENWKKIAPRECFKSPEPNIYCPDDFTLVTLPNKLPEYPLKIHSDSLYEVWYKFDGKFRKPECRINILYTSALPTESLENIVMLDLFAEVLRFLLDKKLHMTTECGLSCKINTLGSSLEFNAHGFSQKFPMMIQTIGQYIGNCSKFVTPKLLDAVMKKQFERYHQISSKLFAHDVKELILRPKPWLIYARRAIIPGIKFDQFRDFVAHYTDRVYVKLLVQGNIGDTDALELVKNFIRLSKCGPMAPSARWKSENKALPRGTTRCCRVEKPETIHGSNHVMNYYQFGEKSVIMSAAIKLLVSLIHHDIFTLPRFFAGLVIYNAEITTDRSCLIGYNLTIEDYIGNKAVTELDVTIENYRRMFVRMLKNWPPNGWDLVKKVFDRLVRCTPTTLAKEMSNNWKAITSGDLMFDRNIREANAIAKLDMEQLRNLIIGLMTQGTHSRKLSIQIVVPSENKEKNVGKSEKSLEKEIKLKFLTNMPNEKEEKRDYYITDIASYKNTLKTVGLKESNSAKE